MRWWTKQRMLQSPQRNRARRLAYWYSNSTFAHTRMFMKLCLCCYHGPFFNAKCILLSCRLESRLRQRPKVLLMLSKMQLGWTNEAGGFIDGFIRCRRCNKDIPIKQSRWGFFFFYLWLLKVFHCLCKFFFQMMLIKRA